MPNLAQTAKMEQFAPTNKREWAGVRQKFQEEALHELYRRMILFYNHIHFNVQQAILSLSTMACCSIVYCIWDRDEAMGIY